MTRRPPAGRTRPKNVSTMSVLFQLKTIIDAGLDDACPAGDPVERSGSATAEVALDVSEEIANDPSIGAAEAARQAAVLAEETAGAAARLQARLTTVRTFTPAG